MARRTREKIGRSSRVGSRRFMEGSRAGVGGGGGAAAAILSVEEKERRN